MITIIQTVHINQPQIQHFPLKNRFAIIALDSSASPAFGQIAERVSSALTERGANEILPPSKIDDLDGQDSSLRIWTYKLARVSFLKTTGIRQFSESLHGNLNDSQKQCHTQLIVYTKVAVINILSDSSEKCWTL